MVKTIWKTIIMAVFCSLALVACGGGEKDLISPTLVSVLVVDPPPAATSSRTLPLSGMVAEDYVVNIKDGHGSVWAADLAPARVPGRKVWVFNLENLDAGRNEIVITASKPGSPDITASFAVNYIPFFSINQSRFIGVMDLGGKKIDLGISTSASGGTVSGSYYTRTGNGTVSSGLIRGTVSGLDVNLTLSSNSENCNEQLTLVGSALSDDEIQFTILLGRDCAGASISGTVMVRRLAGGGNVLGLLGTNLINSDPGTLTVSLSSTDNYNFTGSVALHNALATLTLTARVTGKVEIVTPGVSSLVGNPAQARIRLTLADLSGHFFSPSDALDGGVMVIDLVPGSAPFTFTGQNILCQLSNGTNAVGVIVPDAIEGLQAYSPQY